MQKGNPHDPLLRQVLPVDEEMLAAPGFSHDPVGDLDAAAVPGVIHKYHGRALFITTGSCAINCRYCFRRNFPYADWQLSQQKQAQAIEYIRINPDITEVILSGGDPLLLNNRRLSELLQQLSTIPHLRRIRIHSRLPIVLPARIDAELLSTFDQLSKQIIMVVHCNHANEISSRVASACASLAKRQITLLNQSVLLKGVNDNVERLCQLSEALFANSIMPYYIHLLDKATGTSHFEVPDAHAVKLMRQVQNQLPGYLVPRLVREQAGAAAKTLLPV
jgi:EF-P beta-lysylation protein EpmB